MRETIFLPNSEATVKWGENFARSLSPGDVILLYGNLGTGKTTLVKGIGNGLNIPDVIVSPTFTLINEYLKGSFPLYHLDLYRLTSSDMEDLAPEMYWEGFDVEPGITVIEWPDRLSYYPSHYLAISLDFVENNSRSLEIRSISNS